MKKIILMTILALSLSATAMAHDAKHNAKGAGHHEGLVALPHLMKLVLADPQKLGINAQQQTKLDKILEEVPSRMHPMMAESKELEKNIKIQIMKKQKSYADVQADLAKLQKMEYEITKLQIEAINRIQNVLTPKQYQTVLKKLMKKKRSKKSC